MSHCEVVEVRNSADAVGLTCLRTASKQVFGLRGWVVRVTRGNMRYVPRRVLPALLDVPSGAAPESPCRGLHEALARKNSSRDTRHSAAAWLQSRRNQMRLAHLPLNQQTSGVNVTASLGVG